MLSISRKLNTLFGLGNLSYNDGYETHKLPGELVYTPSQAIRLLSVFENIDIIDRMIDDGVYEEVVIINDTRKEFWRIIKADSEESALHESLSYVLSNFYSGL